MKVNAEITSTRNLNIYVDMSNENQDSLRTPNMYVTNIEIYNTSSYLDGIPVYQKEYDSLVNLFPSEGLTLSEHDLNLFDTLVNEGSCHTTDLMNDIIIINFAFAYIPTYEALHSCGELVYSTSTALYYPCSIYGGIINAIGGCNCKDMCEDNLPYGFMYALLKKKAIDMCLECGHYNQACRYYIKFYKTDNCNCTKKQCGCGNSSGTSTEYTATTSKSTTKNCGCHG